MRTYFATTDAFPLTGHWTLAQRPRAVAIVHPATGVPGRYYRNFALWLAQERQVHVLTYDYRDTGESGCIAPAGSRAIMSDWGVKDQGAALDHAIASYPNLPVWTVGHSLGGMCLPFHEQADRVTRHVAVASGPAHWTRHPWRFTPQVIAFWFVLGPLATRLLGYLPGRALGIGADLPPGVFRQWKRWCTSRGFHRQDWGTLMPEPDFDRMTGEVDLIGISDDVMIPPERVRALSRLYPRARVSFRELSPQSFGLRRAGHIAIFHRSCAAMWPEMVKT